ncbi:MAG: DUF4012 domain-containing protein [Actinomycetota bacterium]|nr:DUF4012 domain-containing protein [Actinomycetota bacterium]
MVAAAAAAGLFVVGVAYRDLSGARNELTAARTMLQTALDNPATLRTADGRAVANAQVDQAVASVARARRKVTGSAPLSLVQSVPGLKTQRAGMVDLIFDVDVATKTAQNLMATLDQMVDRVQVDEGRVPLDALQDLSREARGAAATLRPLARSADGLWGPFADARRRFDEAVRSGAGRLARGADAVDAAAGFLGTDGPRRHLVALQNNAEMRDQGAVLSYAVIRFDQGRYSLERDGSVIDLTLERPAPTPLPPGTSEVFGFIQPTKVWQSVNATADFAFSGRAMADMYQQATGQPVDGVIGMDVPGLAAILRITGPVQLPDIGQAISAENVGEVLLHDLYQGLAPGSSQQGRREKLSDLVKVLSARLRGGSFDAVALGRELGDAAAGGHLRLWSNREPEESTFERTGLGGGPATSDADRTIHLAVQNRNATKVDYFVQPAVRQEVELLRDGTAVVRTTLVVENRAPAGGPPSYQLGPDEFMRTPGEYWAWLLLWGPAGSRQDGGTPESGLVLSHRVVDVGPGESREATFETTIPNAVRDGELMLRLVPQPRLEPVPLEVTLKAPGWKVSSPPAWNGRWDRVVTLRWRVSR